MSRRQTRLLLSWLIVSAAGIVVAEEKHELKPSPFCQGVMQQIGVTPDEAIQKLGKPVSREDRQMKSTHSEGVMDRIVILQYTSARIGFLYLGDTKKYILLGADLTATMFGRALKDHVPPNRAAALSRLGEPKEAHDDPNTLRYFCTTDLNEWVDIVFDAHNQLTARIVFTSHID